MPEWYNVVCRLIYRLIKNRFSPACPYQRVCGQIPHLKVRCFSCLQLLKQAESSTKLPRATLFLLKSSTSAREKPLPLAVSSGENFSAGAPYVEGATVTANVVKNGKAKKIHVLKYKAKKNEKKKIGHRQPYTKVQITAING